MIGDSFCKKIKTINTQDFTKKQYYSGTALDWIPGACSTPKKRTFKDKFKEIAEAVFITKDFSESDYICFLIC